MDYVTTPLRPEDVRRTVQRTLDRAGLRRANEALRRELTELRNAHVIVSGSAVMRRLVHSLAMAARTGAHVLLQGESGTGKELFGRSIHEQSERRDRPFVRVNCATLTPLLVESALFGHERGAFAGATRRAEGAFEHAAGGTLLLDEIAALRPDVQTRLLHAIDAREVTRVGGTAPTRVDVRLVVATTRSLEEHVASGTLRQELCDRLSEVRIEVPALRERAEDIPVLAHRFAMAAAREVGKEIHDFSADALAVLQAWSWPGNVRELRHAVERAVVLSHEPTLQVHLFDHLRQPLASPAASRRTTPSSLATLNLGTAPAPGVIHLTTLNVDEAERALIARALEVTGGNRTRTAQLLGISVRTLRNKLNGPRRAGVGSH
jgi:DNA-binding NtrC family response regulator